MRLLEATAAQQAARDALTSAAWGGRLTPAQFSHREQHLRAHPWARRTLTTWLWCTEKGEVLCSCEAFVDRAFAGRRPGTAATLASVFTAPSLRGQGHASAMLAAVVERLRADPAMLAVTLFSEVGADLYARLGFRPVPSFDTWLDASPAAPLGVEWLEGPLPAPPRQLGDDATLVLDLQPDRLDWQLERERCYAESLGRAPLEVHGARFGAAVITWTAYWKTDELHVLSLDGDSVSQDVLLQAARHAAHRAGLPVVRLWETAQRTPIEGGRRAARDDELPMFLPLAPSLERWEGIHRGLWA